MFNEDFNSFSDDWKQALLKYKFWSFVDIFDFLVRYKKDDYIKVIIDDYVNRLFADKAQMIVRDNPELDRTEKMYGLRYLKEFYNFNFDVLTDYNQIIEDYYKDKYDISFFPKFYL